MERLVGWQEETTARGLESRLRADGHAAYASGRGVHWQVDVGNGRRTFTIHCFWYERVLSDLALGMNLTNGRSSLREKQAPPYAGPEFAFTIFDDGKTTCGGRTRDEDAMRACVDRWLAGATLDALVDRFPFVDETSRRQRAHASQLPTALRESAQMQGELLWVYASERACKITASGSCAFHYGQAQLALAADVDVERATRAWLLDRVAIDGLPAHVPSVEIERHAEWAERDAARWHWLHVRDLDAAIAAIERALAASPVAPFFGTAVEVEHRALALELARIGSDLVPELGREGPWPRLFVRYGERVFQIQSGRVMLDRDEVFRYASVTELAQRLGALIGA